jgi:hypothetical protein
MPNLTCLDYGASLCKCCILLQKVKSNQLDWRALCRQILDRVNRTYVKHTTPEFNHDGSIAGFCPHSPARHSQEKPLYQCLRSWARR